MATANEPVTADHQVSAGERATYHTAGHPPRQESPTYVKSRRALKAISATLVDWYFGQEPYQDHHGGGLWVNDGRGWFFLRNLAGIEWSGQFCADPKKIDVLRRNALRLYARFPESFAAFSQLGIDLKTLLETPINSPETVAVWTDSICNASVPIPEPQHIGSIPKGGGVHNYPTPVTDIDRFRRDDFTLWVVDEQGHAAAVVPQSHLDSGERGVIVAYSTPGSALHAIHHEHESAGKHLALEHDHMLATQAFRHVKKQPAAKPAGDAAGA